MIAIIEKRDPLNVLLTWQFETVVVIVPIYRFTHTSRKKTNTTSSCQIYRQHFSIEAPWGRHPWQLAKGQIISRGGGSSVVFDPRLTRLVQFLLKLHMCTHPLIYSRLVLHSVRIRPTFLPTRRIGRLPRERSPDYQTKTE